MIMIVFCLFCFSLGEINLFIYNLFFIEVWLNYNVVVITTVQQSDSITHIYIVFFIFLSIMVYHRIWNIVPCALQ